MAIILYSNITFDVREVNSTNLFWCWLKDLLDSGFARLWTFRKMKTPSLQLTWLRLDNSSVTCVFQRQQLCVLSNSASWSYCSVEVETHWWYFPFGKLKQLICCHNLVLARSLKACTCSQALYSATTPSHGPLPWEVAKKWCSAGMPNLRKMNCNCVMLTAFRNYHKTDVLQLIRWLRVACISILVCIVEEKWVICCLQIIPVKGLCCVLYNKAERGSEHGRTEFQWKN